MKNTSHKKKSVTIIIAGKINLKTRNITKNKKAHFLKQKK